MKKTRKFAAMAAALTLAACSIAPAMMMNANADNTITITNYDNAAHKYEAYQIFSGTFSGGTLNSIEWGSGVNSNSLLTAIVAANSNDSSVLKGLFTDITTSSSAKDVAEKLGATVTTGTGNDATTTSVFGTDDAKSQAFAELVSANLSNIKTGTVSTEGNVISGVADGYYLIKDSAAPTTATGGQNSGAKTRYIVHVTDNTSLNVNAKHAAPTIDKTVWDDNDGNYAGTKDGTNNETAVAGYYETADHAINEQFTFKLTATLVADPQYAAYDTYRVIFDDTLSAGVTYEEIQSVTVKGHTVDAYTEAPTSGDDNRTAKQKAGYKLTAPTYDETTIGGGDLKIEIGDIKQWLGNSETLADGVTVEVIYKAHLNENATVENADTNSNTDYANVNKVKLKYSNNPNVTGSGDSGTPGNDEETGETPYDFTWVFTYKVDNNKVDENNAALEGAGFVLKNAKGDEISLAFDNTNKFYYPAKNGDTIVAAMTSSKNGSDTADAKAIFNIRGLDAGQYTLEETVVPAGYNKCADIPITIIATHGEKSDNAAIAELDLTATNVNNTVENKKGSTLPSTGGIGTTLFYLAGGVMVVGAGVVLITKKRLGKED